MHLRQPRSKQSVIGLILLTFLLGTTFAQGNSLEKKVADLFDVPSPTGYESPLAEKLKGFFPENAAFGQDNLGSLYFTTGSGEAQLAVLTGMDVIGYVVSGITVDGYLNIYRGVFSPHSLFDVYQFGHPLTIWTKKGPVSGVLALPSSHTLSRERRQNLMKEFTLQYAFVDVGASSREEVEKRGIANLDPITPMSSLFPLAGDKLSGYALGTKICTALVAEVAQAASRQAGGGTTFAWLAQTKQMTRVNRKTVSLGSLRAQKYLKAGKILIVDSFTTGMRSATGIEIGSGPVLIGGSEDSALRGLIEKTAADKGIKLLSAKEFTSPMLSAFTDGDAVGLLLPVKFPYTPSEVISQQDVKALKLLIEAVIKKGRRP